MHLVMETTKILVQEFLYYYNCIFVLFFQMTMYLKLYFGVFVVLASTYGKSTTFVASFKLIYKLEAFLLFD